MSQKTNNKAGNELSKNKTNCKCKKEEDKKVNKFDIALRKDIDDVSNQFDRPTVFVSDLILSGCTVSPEALGIYVMSLFHEGEWGFEFTPEILSLYFQDGNEKSVEKGLTDLEEYGFLAHGKRKSGNAPSDRVWCLLDNPYNYDDACSQIRRQGYKVTSKRKYKFL